MSKCGCAPGHNTHTFHVPASAVKQHQDKYKCSLSGEIHGGLFGYHCALCGHNVRVTGVKRL